MIFPALQIHSQHLLTIPKEAGAVVAVQPLEGALDKLPAFD
jgi:hypothetical protein